MDRIYNKIIESKSKPYIWVYSRFDTSNQSMINDILFQSLSSFQFFNFNNAAAEYFNIDFSKQLKENEFSSNGEMVKKSYTFSSSIESLRDAFGGNDIFDDADEEIEEDGHTEEGNEEGEMENPNMEITQDEVGNNEPLNGEQLFATTYWEPGRYAIFEDNIAAPTVDMNTANAEICERLRERVGVALAQLTNVGGENGTNQ